MSILFVTEDVKKPKLSYRNVTHWIKIIISKYDFKVGELTYIFCNDTYLLDINIKFLNHDFLTDIITFDYSDGNIVSGDLFISLERVKENCLLYSCSYDDELLRVMIHGTLHLLNFNDSNSDEKIFMRRLEEECIKIYRDIENGYIE